MSFRASFDFNDMRKGSRTEYKGSVRAEIIAPDHHARGRA